MVCASLAASTSSKTQDAVMEMLASSATFVTEMQPGKSGFVSGTTIAASSADEIAYSSNGLLMSDKNRIETVSGSIVCICPTLAALGTL